MSAEELLGAAQRGDTALVRAAVAAGAELEVRDAAGRTPLLIAAAEDQVEVAAVLVAAGADVNAVDGRQDTPFLVTGVTGSVEMLRALLPGEPDVTITNRFGGTALIPASERGHAGYVADLLATTDVDVDHVNNLGWTALLEAVVLGDGGPAHQDTVRALIAGGADVNIADAQGVSPLRNARDHGHTALAEILTAAGAR